MAINSHYLTSREQVQQIILISRCVQEAAGTALEDAPLLRVIKISGQDFFLHQCDLEGSDWWIIRLCFGV